MLTKLENFGRREFVNKKPKGCLRAVDAAGGKNFHLTPLVGPGRLAAKKMQVVQCHRLLIEIPSLECVCVNSIVCAYGFARSRPTQAQESHNPVEVWFEGKHRRHNPELRLKTRGGKTSKVLKITVRERHHSLSTHNFFVFKRFADIGTGKRKELEEQWASA